MGSFETVNSGRVSGGRSSFSHKCSLLSQYLKEKGSFGDLSLGLTQNLETKGAPTETMNLLPMIEKSGEDSSSRNLNTPPAVFALPPAAGRDEIQKNSDPSGARSEAGTAQMTIFYGGQVIVFNDFPAEKAKEIMTLASKSSATHNDSTAAFAPLLTAESGNSTPRIVTNFLVQEPPHLSAAHPSLDSDLPIARKNSLARFLEKRKDRVTANAPYPVSKPAKTEAWLGLAPQLPLQIQRH